MKRPLLITAGATRNPIDSMRYITANASGRTGLYLAEQLSDSFDIHLFGSPKCLLQSTGASTIREFSSTYDLLEKMKSWIEQYPNGVIIHSAAVGDFAVEDHSNGKIASGTTLELKLVPTPKILDKIKEWSSDCFLVSFKAAAPHTSLDELKSIAHKQLLRSNSDLVFANVLGAIHSECIVLGKDDSYRSQNRNDALQHLLQLIRLHAMNEEFPSSEVD